MDQPLDLPSLIDQLKTILSTQNLPNTTNNGINNPPILPKTRPHIPPSLRTLPQSPQSSTSTSTSTTSPNSNPLSTLQEHLTTTILPSLNHNSLSANYYGFVIGGATPAALLADWLVSVYDQNVHVHLPDETVATELEHVAVDLLRQLFQLPSGLWASENGGGGLITTGATASNTVGLACAREWVLRRKCERVHDGAGWDGRVSEVGIAEACARAGVKGVKVVSTLPHSSVVKAASVVGIGRANVLAVGVEGRGKGDGDGDEKEDRGLRVDVGAEGRGDVVGEEDNGGLRIDLDKFDKTTDDPEWAFILAISAGEVNTGRFATGGLQDMKRLREICDRKGIWIHVDAAFGLFGRILMDTAGKEEFEEVLKGVEGLELADSITGDGHKLLNVPYDCGMFFTRHARLSEDVFGNGSAAYLASGLEGESQGPVIQSPLNIGIENSRRFRALPIWSTLMAYGRDGYVDMLKRQIGLARKVAAWMWRSGWLEVMPRCGSEEEVVRKTFMVVLFRAKDHELNKALVQKINATGKIYVTGTQWDGMPASRIAVSNWRADVERDFALIQEVLLAVREKN